MSYTVRVNPLGHNVDSKLTIAYCPFVEQYVQIKYDSKETVLTCIEKTGCKKQIKKLQAEQVNIVNHQKKTRSPALCLLSKPLPTGACWCKKKPLILRRVIQVQTTLKEVG